MSFCEGGASSVGKINPELCPKEVTLFFKASKLVPNRNGIMLGQMSGLLRNNVGLCISYHPH